MISKKFLMEIKIKACYHIDFETAPSKGDFLLGPWQFVYIVITWLFV